ncbi:ATP-dependent Clp protease ATP-binding subunit [Candidatus Parcubacteria bacterium]|jgi:ATP-dependent Clp protease ATP-binding subunit ClpC|nr:MAG: ATP-dependent Clp protease ATP-binding subunit [Candidatus Parcubacteria bacterium]
MQPILNKFTTHLKEVLNKATNFAAGNRAKAIDPEHLLYALGVQKGSIAYEILLKAGIRLDLIRQAIQLRDGGLALPANSVKPELSPESKTAIEKGAIIAAKYQHRYIGTEHLLYGLLKLQNHFLNRMWKEQNLDAKEMLNQVIMVLRSTTKFPDITELFEEEKTETPGRDKKSSKTPALDFFATDLTDPKLQAGIDPVIGRQKELERLIHILSRRTKNNPVLLGDPGVGKTAIVEGLAKKIVHGEVPEALVGKKILRLDLSLIVAGTMYRGEFESRLKQLIEEITADPDLIVFIDEIHTIIGAGSASGSMDAANILKPALARGELRVIGATTLDEYRKHIESDAALERRFQPIIINEPSPAETIQILKGLRPNYEKFHSVKIADEAISAAVEFSERYLQDKFLPDKAIDLIDEAAAKKKVEAGGTVLAKKQRLLEKQLAEIEKKKHDAVLSEKFEEAMNLKTQSDKLKNKLQHLLLGGKAGQKSLGTIQKVDIADVVHRITNVPIKDLVSEERDRLLNLEANLRKYIIGQEEAIKAIADAIRRSRVGLRNHNRPIGSFIFMGPSGVGKTEMAKVLAREIFEDENALIRIDMSEFGESFNVSKLIGAPAGYVGYKEGNKLTEPIRRKPYSVVLFDEVEKAHPDVFNLLLQVLEDGHLTDATGKQVNFKNTIIIFTSNVGLQSLNQNARVGFELAEKDEKKKADEAFAEISEQVTAQLKEQFRPEFLNRIDKIIVFRPLTAKDVKQIVLLHLAELQKLAEAQGYKLQILPAAVKKIAELGFSPDQGARAIRKVIQDEIENPMARGILENKFQKGAVLKLKVGKSGFSIE